MREIEFRGKVWNHIKNEWIWKYGPDMLGFVGSQPETIGQYIGRKDKNKQKIYEGDIVLLKIGGGLEVEGFVKYYPKFYAFCAIGEFDGWEPLHRFISMKVIGNVFDDPSFREKYWKYWEERDKE